eukprot:5800234-Pyramimonas_sp.AAC.1
MQPGEKGCAMDAIICLLTRTAPHTPSCTRRPTHIAAIIRYPHPATLHLCLPPRPPTKPSIAIPFPLGAPWRQSGGLNWGPDRLFDTFQSSHSRTLTRCCTLILLNKLLFCIARAPSNVQSFSLLKLAKSAFNSEMNCSLVSERSNKTCLRG